MAAVPLLGEWGEFYVITGTSAAALTGLTYVVITVSAQARPRHPSEAIGAFVTPTVVHLFVPLVLAGTLTAPWPGLGPLAWVLGVYGVAGVAYSLLTAWRTGHQEDYSPVLEDWLFHGVFPVAAYALLGLAALLLPRRPEPGLFAVAGTTLGLLIIGIHNAWDTMTYFAARGVVPDDGSSPGDAPVNGGPGAPSTGIG